MQIDTLLWSTHISPIKVEFYIMLLRVNTEHLLNEYIFTFFVILLLTGSPLMDIGANIHDRFIFMCINIS